MNVSNVDGTLAMHDGTLELDPLRASLFGGTSQTRLRYDLAAAVPQLTLDQRLAGVDTAAMLAELLDQKRVSGRGTLTAHLSGAGRDRKTLLRNLSGPFEVQVTDGRFVGVDVWAEIERAIATARGATPSRRAGSAYTPFDRFEAKGRLDGTVIRNESFDVTNASMRARGQGTVNYGTGALDLALTARLLEAPGGEVAGISLDRIVGVDIPLTVRGSMSEPKVRPDTTRLARGSRQAAASGGGRRDREEAQGEARGQAQGPARAMSRSATLAALAIALLPAAAQALSVAVARGKPQRGRLPGLARCAGRRARRGRRGRAHRLRRLPPAGPADTRQHSAAVGRPGERAGAHRGARLRRALLPQRRACRAGGATRRRAAGDRDPGAQRAQERTYAHDLAGRRRGDERDLPGGVRARLLGAVGNRASLRGARPQEFDARRCSRTSRNEARER